MAAAKAQPESSPEAQSAASTRSTEMPPPTSAHQKHWDKTWIEFNRALRSPEPFNPFPWIFRLSKAGLYFGYCQSGLNVIVDKYRLTKIWTSALPWFVLGLVVFLAVLYACSLRTMILERWCGGSYCTLLPLHDVTVFYLVSMILYNYFKTNLSSPGVALSPQADKETWSCMDNRGGFYGSRGYPMLNATVEGQRVSLYGKLGSPNCPQKSSETATKKMKSSSGGKSGTKTIFPSPDPSYCNKCKILRPPRCHHCRVCNRCVLQFDHHCLWVNNCIGYNNYRAFLALLVHIVLACWYAIAVLVVPFYELIREEQARQSIEYSSEEENEDGWLVKWILAYQRSQMFEDVPANPWALYQGFQGDEGLPWGIAVKIAYPLLLSIGTVMTLFLGFHIQYVMKARTMLEHKIILETLCTSLWKESFAGSRLSPQEPSIQNPFDDGWQRNVHRILGPQPWYLFLPIHVEPPPPFVPHKQNEELAKKTK